MAFIVKNKNRYYELVRNIRVDGKVKRQTLYYMGKELTIPYEIIEKHHISDDNIDVLQAKYFKLKIK
jgi:hypothetical protein